MTTTLPAHGEISELPQNDTSLSSRVRRLPLKLLMPTATEDHRVSVEKWIPLTRHIEMLLELDRIPSWHSLLASLFSWLLLAGYIVLPATFTSLRSSQVVRDGAGMAGELVLKAVDNVPLLWTGAICCIMGGLKMGCLSWRWKRNYEWLLHRIITPSLLHSAVGFINTLVNIYTAQHGIWSVTAVITATVTGSCTAFMVGLFFLYDIKLLPQVKKLHELKMEAERHGKNNMMP